MQVKLVTKTNKDILMMIVKRKIFQFELLVLSKVSIKSFIVKYSHNKQ